MNAAGFFLMHASGLINWILISTIFLYFFIYYFVGSLALSISCLSIDKYKGLHVQLIPYLTNPHVSTCMVLQDLVPALFFAKSFLTPNHESYIGLLTLSSLTPSPPPPLTQSNPQKMGNVVYHFRYFVDMDQVNSNKLICCYQSDFIRKQKR